MGDLSEILFIHSVNTDHYTITAWPVGAPFNGPLVFITVDDIKKKQKKNTVLSGNKRMF